MLHPFLYFSIHAATVSRTEAYHICILTNARALGRSRDVLKPVDAVMSQCEPLLHSAAEELKRSSPPRALENLRAAHADPERRPADLDVVVADMVRDAGRNFAKQIVIDEQRTIQAKKPFAGAPFSALIDDPPIAPASGSR